MEKQKNIEVVAAIIQSGGKYFTTQRGYGDWKDWWEFPGGKIEPGESHKEALRREIREELATEIEVGSLLTTVEYDYPKFHLTMHCYLCTVVSGNLLLLEHEDARWLSGDELDTVKWLPADRSIIELLKEKR
ncbi:MAG: (deoxy)nucleoside triphosphate pyrophosphohydrolase [Paludibacteraceae bacterium]|nr:(deoxy)nucleoside triphosphate pyrophosphohydrolase [Paludibacteraceae bacterium]